MRRAFALVACLALGCSAARDDRERVDVVAVSLPPEVFVDSVGPTYPALSRSCGAVAFASGGQVYLHELGTPRFELVSATETGAPGDHPSGLPALSADARRVAFNSAAKLLPVAVNRHDHVYVRDLDSAKTLLTSVSTAGTLADDANLGLNTGLSLSADGSAVAFSSYSTNLVADDRNRRVDVFVHELVSRTTTRASLGSSGGEAHGDSAHPALAAGGRFVAFSSTADDLVPGDANRAPDVFVRDREKGITERVSSAPDGTQPNGASDLPAISADGRFVAFTSDATNLVTGDTNGARDVFLWDREARVVRRISAGASDYPEIDDDGSRVAFASRAVEGSDHQQIVVRDLRSGRSWIASAGTDASPGNDDSGDWGLSLSGDGRCVAFTSLASNLGAVRPPALVVARIPR